MPATLNLTLQAKQDLISKVKIAYLQNKFGADFAPKIDAALKKSGIVHFARLVVIGSEYFQILTEYDGDFRAYTDFFVKELGDVFEQLFEVIEGAPTGPDAHDPDKFYAFLNAHNIPSLGNYLFSAYGTRSVAEIKKAIGLNGNT